MSIKRKLGLFFGGMIGTVSVLCIISLLAVQREHSARSATQHAFEVAQASESIRFQMMQNRQLLSNYLLSGSTGDVNSLTDGMSKLQDAIGKLAEKTGNDQQKSTLQKLGDTERECETNFARPLTDNRRQVDNGNATVSDLQIQYLQ